MTELLNCIDGYVADVIETSLAPCGNSHWDVIMAELENIRVFSPRRVGCDAGSNMYQGPGSRSSIETPYLNCLTGRSERVSIFRDHTNRIGRDGRSELRPLPQWVALGVMLKGRP